MKKLNTNIITENGETKKITVFVEDETAAAFFPSVNSFAKTTNPLTKRVFTSILKDKNNFGKQ